MFIRKGETQEYEQSRTGGIGGEKRNAEGNLMDKRAVNGDSGGFWRKKRHPGLQREPLLTVLAAMKRSGWKQEK